MKKEMKTRSLFQTLKFGFKVAVIVEAAIFIGSYVLWRKMNRDRDFRHRMHQKAPYLLRGYYVVGEAFGDQTTRDKDYTVWGIKN